MESLRPTKRTRIACTPCRRKKSRCPGERPSCSYCVRLRQTCFYSMDQEPRSDSSYHGANQDLESRVGSLEAKIDTVIQSLAPLQNKDMALTPPERADATPERSEATQGRSRLVSTQPMQVSPLSQVGELYLQWYQNQPLRLFNADTFLETFESRDKGLCLALQALICRFPPGGLNPRIHDQMCEAANSARRIVTASILNGNVSLATLQTLCLLSIFEFSEGNSLKAGLDLNTAEFLSNGLHENNFLEDVEETHECAQSIIFLQNLFGVVASRGQQLGASLGSFRPLSLSEPIICQPLHSDDNGQRDISWYCYQLSHVWKMAREYAATRVDQSPQQQQLPPWNPQSDHSSVTMRHLELDSRVPLKYRYAANDFSRETAETLQNRRHYWGPYLSLQLIYAAIPCLLNHPFLLSLRLRNFRYNMPQMFIHHCFEQITRHAGWIMHFMDVMERHSFQVSDPTVAHCVVIVATIHLQHSFVKDPAMKNKAEEAFERCLGFLQRMGLIWPNVNHMAKNLKQLQESIELVHRSGSPTGNERSWTVDSQLLWNLLIYETAGRPGADVDQSIYGSSLRSSKSRGRNENAVEFGLIGSTGISGHSSVPKETPVYAPGDRGVAGQIPNNIHRPTLSMQETLDDPLFQGFEGFTGQDNMWQPNDFGKAIDDWLTLDFQE